MKITVGISEMAVSADPGETLVTGEETGGSQPRTMSLRMQTGRTVLASHGMEREI
jgi:hypothetical protein